MGLTQITTGGVDDNINIDSNTLKVDGTNNRVGIGTATAGRTLSVNGSIQVSNSTSGFGLGEGFEILHESGGSTYLLNRENAETRFYTNNTERMRIDSSGNVGVGTTSIASGGANTTNFNVHTPSATSVYLKLSNSSTGNSASDAFDLSADSSGNAYLINRENGNMTFWTNATERLRIDSSGNVGIGVTSLSSSSRLTLLESAGNAQTLEIKGANSGGAGSQPGIKFTASSGDNIGGIFGDTNTDAVILQTGGSERMRIDSSGRLMVGSTSNSGAKLFVAGGSGQSVGTEVDIARFFASTASSTNSGGLTIGGVWHNTDVNQRIAYLQSEQNQNPGSTARHLALNPGGGNVGIGTKLPDQKLQLEGTGSQYIAVTSTDSDNTGVLFGDSDIDSGYVLYANSDNSLRIGANAGERMRIDSGGNFAFGSSSTTRTQASRSIVFTVPNNADISINHSTQNGSGDFYLVFGYNGTAIGSVTQNGNSAVSYNTTSDYRLKENVVDLDGAITRVKQLAPKRFNFIADDSRIVDGFLAHEAQVVVPEAVTGTHDEVDDDGNAVMQGIDQSKLVPLLTAALQEAIAKIETLETKVAALEAAE